MSGLVLSLFPGIGLLDMAFEEEGFCVVRGPDVLWGGDIRNFHPPAGRFEGVIGGPPCQSFSPLANLNRHLGNTVRFGNLIPEFERVVREAFPQWFLMENVPAAPEPQVAGYCINPQYLDNRWLGEVQARSRKFVFGAHYRVAERFNAHAECVALEAFQRARTVTSNNGGMSRGRLDGTDSRLPICLPMNEVARLQGLPEDFLVDAPFTKEGKRRAIANGVPLPMGRAIARAVKLAIDEPARQG
jgi:DNA (cytosine-5)-methyltransferase 1